MINNTNIRSMEIYFRGNNSGDTVMLTNSFDYELSGNFISCDKWINCEDKSTVTHIHNSAITKVMYNNPVVIVFWNDGTKTIAKCHNEDFDPEKGLYVAILKKILGNDGFRTLNNDWEDEVACHTVTLKDVRHRRKAPENTPVEEYSGAEL